MAFDLEGRIVIDYSEVDQVGPELEARTAGATAQAKLTVDGHEARADAQRALEGIRADVKIRPELDDSALDPSLRDLKHQIEARVPGIFAPLNKGVDLSPARREIRTLTSDFQDQWRQAVRAFNTGTVEEYLQALDRVKSKANEVQEAMQGQGPAAAVPAAPAAGKARGGFWNEPIYTGLMFVGGMALGGGLSMSAAGAAMSEQRMATTMDQVFGEAAETFKAQADEISASSGHAAAALMQTQVALNRVRETAGLTDDQLLALSKLSADMASSSGLPQYADNLTATGNALVQGLQNGGAALADFGIRLDDAYIQTLRVNRAYAANWDELTEAEKAQARYNAIIEQSGGIADDAREANEGAAGSWRKLIDKLNEGKEAVGEVLLPVVNSIASLVDKIPPELIQGGIWTAIVVGFGLAAGAAVNGIRMVIQWLVRLAAQAHITSLSGGAGKVPGVPTGTPKTPTPVPTGTPIPTGAEKAAEAAGRAVGRAAQTVGTALGKEALKKTAIAVGTSGAASVAAPAVAAAVAAGSLDVYAINEARREVDNYWDTVALAHKQAALNAKKTGAPSEDVYAYPYVAREAKWTGSGYEYYNYAGKKLGPTAQAWQESFRREDPGRWAQQNIKISIGDATHRGVSVIDAHSYAESAY